MNRIWALAYLVASVGYEGGASRYGNPVNGISIIVAMSRVLRFTGINETMVSPLTRFLRTPAMAYWESAS